MRILAWAVDPVLSDHGITINVACRQALASIAQDKCGFRPSKYVQALGGITQDKGGSRHARYIQPWQHTAAVFDNERYETQTKDPVHIAMLCVALLGGNKCERRRRARKPKRRATFLT